MNADLNALFTAIEAAVDAHASLSRTTKMFPKGAEAAMHVTRDGWTASILVRLQGSNKRPAEISAFGATAEEAAQKLIDGLDSWVNVW